MLVKVAVSIPTDKTFTYRVPETLRSGITVGKRVLIPFGRRRQTGYILEITDEESGDALKDLLEISDPDPLFAAEDLRFYQWAADYYLYPLGKTLSEIIPGEDRKSSRRLFLLPPQEETPPDLLTAGQVSIIETLKSSSGGLSVDYLKRRSKHPGLEKDIKWLCDKGLIEVCDHLGGRTVPRRVEKMASLNPDRNIAEKLTTGQLAVIDLVHRHGEVSLPRLKTLSGRGRGVINALIGKGILSVREGDVLRSVAPVAVLGAPGRPFRPNEAQLAALGEITTGLDRGGFFPCLLHGVRSMRRNDSSCRSPKSPPNGSPRPAPQPMQHTPRPASWPG